MSVSTWKLLFNPLSVSLPTQSIPVSIASTLRKHGGQSMTAILLPGSPSPKTFLALDP